MVASIAAVLFIVNPFKEQSDELNKIVVLPLETNSKDQDQINLAVGLTQDISGALTGASKQLNIIMSIKFQMNCLKFMKRCKQVI